MNDKQTHEFKIPSCFRAAKDAEDKIVAEALTWGYDQDNVFALRLSLEEALANAIQHGNVYDVDKQIRIRYQVNDSRIDVYVRDEGRGFDPAHVPDPTSPDNLERPTGRGIMLMKAYMNLVEYNETGNVVHLVKFNKAG